jgi:hypothetical protein
VRMTAGVMAQWYSPSLSGTLGLHKRFWVWTHWCAGDRRKLCGPSATELELGVPRACWLGLLLCSKKQKQKPCARTNLGEKSVWFYPHPFYFSSLWNVLYLSLLWFHPQTGAQLWVLFTHNCLLVMSKCNV